MSAFYHGNIPQLATDLVQQNCLHDHGTLRSHGYNLSPADLGKKLHDMNVDALTQRYEKCKDMCPAEYEHHDGKPSPDVDAAVYHRLRCYLYQCNEGDVDECDLFKALSKVEDMAARFLADRADPGFEWGN